MERDRFGQESKPFYSSLRVLNSECIILLQKKLLEHFSYTIIPQEELHLTIFHFGKPNSLYQDVIKFVPNLKFDDFLSQFREFQSSLKMPHTKIKLNATNLDIFGKSDSPILVIRLEKSDQLRALRMIIFNQFEDFTQNLGIKNTREFMCQSEDLKYQLDEKYTPHVSIGYQIKDKIPQILTYSIKPKNMAFSTFD